MCRVFLVSLSASKIIFIWVNKEAGAIKLKYQKVDSTMHIKLIETVKYSQLPLKAEFYTHSWDYFSTEFRLCGAAKQLSNKNVMLSAWKKLEKINTENFPSVP